MEEVYLDKQFDVFGFKITTDNDTELTKKALIPGLWNKFCNSNFFTDINYGIYYNYENKHFGKYDLLLGNTFSSNDNLNKVTIQSGKYLVFKDVGKMHEIVPKLWFEIWNFFDKSKIKRAYKTDFERYNQDDYVEIFISIL